MGQHALPRPPAPAGGSPSIGSRPGAIAHPTVRGWAAAAVAARLMLTALAPVAAGAQSLRDGRMVDDHGGSRAANAAIAVVAIAIGVLVTRVAVTFVRTGTPASK